MPEGYLHLTCEQRCQIYALLQSGHSQARCARAIALGPPNATGPPGAHSCKAERRRPVPARTKPSPP